jgi:hypothetical protein
MSWETRRNGNRYYYRSRRQDGRVVREYVGGGEKGRRAAEADAAARDSREQAAKLLAEKNRPVDGLAAHLDVFGKIVDQLVTCQLLCAGWRRHHRGWREPKSGRIRRHH